MVMRLIDSTPARLFSGGGRPPHVPGECPQGRQPRHQGSDLGPHVVAAISADTVFCLGMSEPEVRTPS
ncbi:hypothetical protein DN051_06650 [Streptomyces cadmiisoli]|uniref:Uncharacterized protein n=1 Tax=Streptomyces cadmiisoli TaxID=2184053 RepID=A0A2Z4IUI9_9ACTN|nr:hypothetical protein DN051_06650 [Streptomyces cadmiisoli]